MSKRTSTGPSNTLFNYFTKTPPANKKPKKNDDDATDSSLLDTSINGERSKKFEIKKRERQPTTSPENKKQNSDSEDDVTIAPAKKRKRIRINPIDSDDSDTENKADNKIDDKPKEKISIEKKLNDSFKYEANQSPKSSKQNKSKATNDAQQTPKDKPTEERAPVSDDGNWVHCKLAWLKPENIRDAKKRRPDHPDYDPATLYVPPDFYNAQTPAHRQWWEMKSLHYDCVLFFKVGKFYELYHMDAAVGVNELGFSYMKGEFAHSGFPESAYGRMSSTLVSKGYKIARVEQTETPDMMQERCRQKGQTTKWDKVVKREICQVTVRGTQVCGLQDPGPGEASANYMMAIAEENSNLKSEDREEEILISTPPPSPIHSIMSSTDKQLPSGNSESSISSSEQHINPLNQENTLQATNTDQRNEPLNLERYEYMSKMWVEILKTLPKEQRIIAEKLINDVFYEAQLNGLSRESHVRVQTKVTKTRKSHDKLQ